MRLSSLRENFTYEWTPFCFEFKLFEESFSPRSDIRNCSFELLLVLSKISLLLTPFKFSSIISLLFSYNQFKKSYVNKNPSCRPVIAEISQNTLVGVALGVLRLARVLNIISSTRFFLSNLASSSFFCLSSFSILCLQEKIGIIKCITFKRISHDK